MNDFAVAIVVEVLATLFILAATRRQGRLRYVLLVAFHLRWVAALVHRFVAPLPDTASDATDFEVRAAAWAQLGWSQVDATFTIGARLYSWILSLLYLVFGREPLLGQALNVALGTVLVVVVHQAGRALWSPGSARTLAWLAALWPSLVLYSAVTMRETWVIVPLTTGAWLAIRWSQDGRWRFLVGAVAGFVTSALFHGTAAAALGVLVLAALAGPSIAQWRRRPVGRALAQAAFMVGLVALVLLQGGLASQPAGGTQLFTFEGIAHRANNAVPARTQYLEGLAIDSWGDLLWQAPVRAAYFLASPFPWDVLDARTGAIALEGLLYIALTVQALRGAKVTARRRATLLVAAMTVAMLGALAFTTYNAGTAFRHRAKLSPLLLLLLPSAWALLHHVPRRLLIVLNDAMAFASRRPLAIAARARGWEVHVASPGAAPAGMLETGATHHSIHLDRGGLGPLKELRTLVALRRVLRRVRPGVVHAFSLKPMLHGGLASRAGGAPRSLATVTGLGYAFTSDRPRARLARALMVPALSLAADHPRACLMFQNRDDEQVFTSLGIADAHDALLVPGSGVDLVRFRPVPEPAGPVRFVLPARMLLDKGIAEFVEAARRCRAIGSQAEFHLVGDVDPGNPASLTRDQIEAWATEGAIHWTVSRDMASTYAAAHVVVLPSYREGVPRVLLEGAACARPLVATDVPGCRDVAIEGVTGLLVPAADPAALTEALLRLERDPALRQRLGIGARAHVEARFSVERVIEQTLAAYEHERPLF